MYHTNIIQTNFVKYLWLSLIIIDYHWLLLIIIDYHWSPLITVYYHWLSWLSWLSWLYLKIWQCMTHSLTYSLKSRDASASKKKNLDWKKWDEYSWNGKFGKIKANALTKAKHMKKQVNSEWNSVFDFILMF